MTRGLLGLWCKTIYLSLSVNDDLFGPGRTQEGRSNWPPGLVAGKSWPRWMVGGYCRQKHDMKFPLLAGLNICHFQPKITPLLKGDRGRNHCHVELSQDVQCQDKQGGKSGDGWCVMGKCNWRRKVPGLFAWHILSCPLLVKKGISFRTAHSSGTIIIAH